MDLKDILLPAQQRHDGVRSRHVLWLASECVIGQWLRKAVSVFCFHVIIRIHHAELAPDSFAHDFA